MKKKKTKGKVVFSFDPVIIDFLKENFTNKSKYIEYLIQRNMKENGLLKKDIIL